MTCLDSLAGKIDFHAFQISTASRVIEEMQVKAMLADEVGLGKTIEAGLVLKELAVRGLIANALVLVPKSLEYQWQLELIEKFDEQFFRFPDVSRVRLEDHSRPLRLIAGHSLMSRDDSFNALDSRLWDIVIVDEAHRFNKDSLMNRNLQRLKKTRMILLTATPLQNSIDELLRLVTLARPDIGLARADWMYFSMDSTGRTIRSSRLKELHEILSRVMCRTTRAETGLVFPPREVFNISVRPSEDERQLISDTYKLFFVLGRASSLPHGGDLLRLSLLQSLSSHPRALLESLSKIVHQEGETRGILNDIKAKIEEVKTPSKETALFEYLGRQSHAQAVIFVERIATGEALTDDLQDSLGKAIFYYGGLRSDQRQSILRSFREGSIRYLVSTSAGSEGLNLQNSHIVVNYDLHWNPLKLEQRIGRVHRFGQKETVQVVNLTTKGTIDDLVLAILWNKIDLFHRTIGEIDTILSTSDDEFDVESRIQELIISSKSEGEIEKKLVALDGEFGSRIEDYSTRVKLNESILNSK